MPRVTEAYRTARRQQILHAAWRCFARDGFHGTTMQDIFNESDLSAGAVYRYFPSKLDLVRATAESVTEGLFGAFDELDSSEPVPPPDRALRLVIDTAIQTTESGEVNLGRVAIHVWSEALHESEIAEVVRAVGMRIRRRWSSIAARWKSAGHIASDADPEEVARLLYGVMAGFVVQRHLLGDITPDQYVAGIAALTGRSRTNETG